MLNDFLHGVDWHAHGQSPSHPRCSLETHSVSAVQPLDTPQKRVCAHVHKSVPSAPSGGCLRVWGPGLPSLDPSHCCDLEPQECLTLAVPARVARGAVAVAGADVEMPVVPAAHAARVPGDLWPDKEGTLEAQGSWDRPSGCSCPPPITRPNFHTPATQKEAGKVGTYHRAPLRGPRL